MGKKIDKKTNVNVVVGKNDKDTTPNLSEYYFKQLQKQNIPSNLLVIETNHDHQWVFTNEELLALGKEIVN